MTRRLLSRADHGIRDLSRLVRALRLPFSAASALSYWHGAVASQRLRDPVVFAFGMGMVVFTHLSANVANDYADAVSGADARDPRYFGFFGGAKLIQEGRITVDETRRLAAVLAGIAVICMVAAALATRSLWVPIVYALVLSLGWAYSCRPAALSYRGLGELTVFLLFGPAAFSGGWFLQARTLPASAGLAMACVHGALITAILMANEVADAEPDRWAGKRTLVVRIGARHGWLCCAALGACAYGLVVAAWPRNGPVATGLALAGAFPFALAVALLRQRRRQREELTVVAKLLITAHAWTAVCLVVGVLA